MLNILELRLICDNIKKFGGFREKDILKNLKKVEVIMENEDHKVYEFTSTEDKYFEYDFKSHRIVG